MVFEHVLTEIEFRVVALVTGINRTVVCYFVIVFLCFSFMLLKMYIHTTLGSEFGITIWINERKIGESSKFLSGRVQMQLTS